jgi:hypothetical protein
MSPRRGSTPRHTDWPTVSRKATLTPSNSQNRSSNVHSSTYGTSVLHKKPRGTAAIGCFSAGPRLLLPSTIERYSFFNAATRPVEAAHRASYPEKTARPLHSAQKRPFLGPTQTPGVGHDSAVINTPVRVTNDTVRWWAVQWVTISLTNSTYL